MTLSKNTFSKDIDIEQGAAHPAGFDDGIVSDFCSRARGKRAL